MRVLAMEFAEETEVGYGALPGRSCVGFAITMVGIPEGMSGETQIVLAFRVLLSPKAPFSARVRFCDYPMSDTSTPSYAPASKSVILPPPASSAGVPSSCTLPGIPNLFTALDKAKKPVKLAIAIKLCPQPCPMPGSASYSALKLTHRPRESLLSLRASKAVFTP